MNAPRLTYALLLLIFLSADGLAQKGTLAGKVTDESGAGISAVRVQIYADAAPFGGVISDRSVLTAPDGKFSIELAPGLYDVVLLAHGFDPVAEKLLVEPDKGITFGRSLKANPYIFEELLGEPLIVPTKTSVLPDRISTVGLKKKK
jgi:Carboxypeptidase regulatory-like domain